MRSATFEYSASVNDNHENNAIRIHSHISGALVVASLLTAAYAFIITGVPFSFMKEGRLIYISEAFQDYCGWTVVIVGTTGGIVTFAQFVASLHMQSNVALVATLLQFLGWNVIIGVSNTGWVAHYIFLVIFFVSSVLFHRIASITPPYASSVYQKINCITILSLPIFAILFCCAALDAEKKKMYISSTVTMEFILTLCSVLEQLCLAYGIGKCSYMTLTFEDTLL
jgi:hypothetical protein